VKWNWGTGIVVTFIVFGAAVMTVVFMAMNERVDLVTDDYYEQELRHQERINEMRRTQTDQFAPTVLVAQGAIEIRFPAAMPRSVAEGEVTLYRPSDRLLDKTFMLTLDAANVHTIPAAVVTPGQWRVKVRWTVADSTYYHEQRVTLP
jgi:nitrogen fixation protein FixH